MSFGALEKRNGNKISIVLNITRMIPRTENSEVI